MHLGLHSIEPASAFARHVLKCWGFLHAGWDELRSEGLAAISAQPSLRNAGLHSYRSKSSQ